MVMQQVYTLLMEVQFFPPAPKWYEDKLAKKQLEEFLSGSRRFWLEITSIEFMK